MLNKFVFFNSNNILSEMHKPFINIEIISNIIKAILSFLQQIKQFRYIKLNSINVGKIIK